MSQKYWISADQLKLSLNRLRSMHPFFGMTYLAFKALNVPSGQQVDLRFSPVMKDFLQRYYRPIGGTATYYYSPFQTSDPRNRWLTHKYPSGALQRITVDTFRSAIIHEKRKPRWGWADNYVEILDRRRIELGSSRIPIFDLAVWLYRQDDIVNQEKSCLVRRFEKDFNISSEEHKLFDFDIFDEEVGEWTSHERISERTLARIIGRPTEPVGGSVYVDFMDFQNVGPMRSLRYEPTQRVNLITGDNSLGKTFLLECLWWALTGKWVEYPAAPLRAANTNASRILYCLRALEEPWDFEAQYDHQQHTWQHTRSRQKPAGLAIYARYDGSYSVWDTTVPTDRHGASAASLHEISLSRNELWHGKTAYDRNENEVSVCNGLLSDWVSWQTRPSRFSEVFGAFAKSIDRLSPPDGQRFEIAEPVWIPGDEREIPALKMEYGDVPLVHASASVKRVVALAYVTVWTWFRHKRNATLANRAPQDSMVVMVDEVEAHLHPKWQRSIVPAILHVIGSLSNDMIIQTHIATHSPLVLASAEPILERPKDSLHHLFVDESEVMMESEELVNYGSVNAWLVSDIFGLKHARSMEAERTIEKAMHVQMSTDPCVQVVRDINRKLTMYLRDDDEYWPRWRYFFESVDEVEKE